jgi:acyl carrier protein
MTDRLTEIFSDILDVDIVELSDNSSPDTIDNWDSLAAMHLVTALEESFAVRLSTREIMRMSSIGLARETLRQKGAEV